jgi:hypothetical protein
MSKIKAIRGSRKTTLFQLKGRQLRAAFWPFGDRENPARKLGLTGSVI